MVLELNVIGFIRIYATRINEDDGYQIGRFTSNSIANPNTWYSGKNTTSISLDTLLDESNGNNYGAKIDTTNYTVDNNWGLTSQQANLNVMILILLLIKNIKFTIIFI